MQRQDNQFSYFAVQTAWSISALDTMPRICFYELKKIIRFDDITSREEKREKDQFTALSEIFDDTNTTFPDFCITSPHMMIGENASTVPRPLSIESIYEKQTKDVCHFYSCVVCQV